MELKDRKYKMTDVGLIPSDWEVKLGYELSEKITKGASPKWQGFAYQDFGLLFVTSENVREGRLEILEPKYLPISFSEKQKNSQLENGDLLINIVGASIGRACIFNLNAPANINQAVCLFRPLGNINHSFLLYFFQSPNTIKRLIGNQTDSARPNLSLTDIRFFKIPLPNLAEQSAIATALNDADALITQLEKLIAKKRAIKQGAMQELLRPKEGWEVKILNEVVDCLDNLRVPLNEAHRTKMEGIYPYCGANGILGYIDDYRIDDEVILIAEDGGYFDEYLTRPIAYKMKGKFWANNHAHILKAKENNWQDFVFFSLVHKNILRFLASGTRAKLNKSEMNKIEINVPKTKDEQMKIATILNDIDIEMGALEKQLEKYKMLKQGMMQNLLTGKIRLI